MALSHKARVTRATVVTIKKAWPHPLLQLDMHVCSQMGSPSRGLLYILFSLFTVPALSSREVHNAICHMPYISQFLRHTHKYKQNHVKWKKLKVVTTATLYYELSGQCSSVRLYFMTKIVVFAPLAYSVQWETPHVSGIT